MTKNSKPTVSACGTYHLDDSGRPLYQARFDEVLAFHRVNERWLAPVRQGHEAWHIDVHGVPAYERRFIRCFGFYFGYAAVVDQIGWFHIDANGAELYSERYQFVGNFQDDCVVVTDVSGDYFHIDKRGYPLNDFKWAYCGDFRDGIAVVQSHQGVSSHIRKDGVLLHDKWFLDLDVYHKGFARAKDSQGWHHVDKEGRPIYPQHYVSIEPFYNGFARCETDDGSLVVIDELGEIRRQLRAPLHDEFDVLSSDMVGYWRTFTIATAVKLGIFEHLPANSIEVAAVCNCDLTRLQRLMRALQELRLVIECDNVWNVTTRGAYLSVKNPKTLADAALEYGNDLLLSWNQLPQLMQGKSIENEIFKLVASTPERLKTHHRMLASYAAHDYEQILEHLTILPGMTVVDAGGGSGTLARLIQHRFPDANIILGDLPQVIEASQFKNKIELDLFGTWPVYADRIVLARILHDWNDADAIKILRSARNALVEGGMVWVVEMVLDQTSASGSLCDLHLLVVTGGQERTKEAYSKLAEAAGLRMLSCQATGSLVSIMGFQK